MKGIVFPALDEGFFPASFPSLAFNSGTIQKEDMYRYEKRLPDGTMRRIGYIGAVLKIECKWNLLTYAQFHALMQLISQEYFYVKFDWKNQTHTDKFYSGNASATPFRIGANGKPLYYTNVSVNVISLETYK